MATMIQVNVHEAKSQLSRLIEAALAGERVTIARAGKPVVDLVIHERRVVTPGLPGWAGARIDTDLLDEPDPELAEQFYGDNR